MIFSTDHQIFVLPDHLPCRLNIENPELKTARTYLDSPPRTAIPNRTEADNAAERYREAAQLLRVHLAHAARSNPERLSRSARR